MIASALFWVAATLALSVYQGEKDWRYLNYPAVTLATSAVFTLPLAVVFLFLTRLP